MTESYFSRSGSASSFWKFENAPGPISSQPNSFEEQRMTDDRCRQIPPSPSVEMQKRTFLITCIWLKISSCLKMCYEESRKPKCRVWLY